MTREEFMRRWELLPDLKKAELIDGVVYVPSPVSQHHADFDGFAALWLGPYIRATPGCRLGTNATTYILESAAQPDLALRILSEYGGGMRDIGGGKYLTGAPELIIEICQTSTEYDFGPKLRLYQRAQVPEYLTLETMRKKVIWRQLIDGAYVPIQPDFDSYLKSRVFPGLWLDVEALWSFDLNRLASAVEAGTHTPEHAEFVKKLACRITW
jgi:Uma2 family endonuclease